MFIDEKDTLCIATNELMGSRYRLTKLVQSTNRFARFSDLSGTTCVSRAGIAVGTEKAAYVISDEYGFNDTTFVTTYVYARAVKRPQAIKDISSTLKSQPVLIDILANDSLNGNRGQVTIVTKPKKGQATITADFRIVYTPDIDFCSSQSDVFTYQLCNNGGCDTAQVEVTVVCDKIKIYNGFSPNGDGFNDFFIIEGIEKFQNNTVSIYNRWGTEVMKTKGYKNDWDGKWKNENLPDGTYFYIFEDGEGNRTTGFVQIQR
jgi:gliding motility-associated-like protein